MEPWSNSSGDPPTNRQPRYTGNVLPQNPSPQHSREYTTTQQPSSQQPQHHAQAGYQTYHGQTGSNSQLSPTSTRLENSSDYMDVQMQDADSFSRGKFQQPSQPQQQARQPYLGTDESTTTQRYSPMAQQAQYTTSNPPHPSQSSNLSQMSSYQQHRQSPSRPNYTNASQSYYAHGSSAGSPRTGALPSIQNYQHPLQQSTSLQPSGPLPTNNPALSLEPVNLSQNIGSDANGGARYYPQSATVPQSSMFDHPSLAQASPVRDPPPRLQRLSNVNELRPRINTQPAHRRANPEGGFISVCTPRNRIGIL
jgi:dual specificity protein kinase YAK1